jgi:hypothetical protein
MAAHSVLRFNEHPDGDLIGINYSKIPVTDSIGKTH